MANSLPNSSPEEKRRSERIVQAVPLTVLGVDALGRPFQERTSTTIVNCHGCRYQSKHYVLKNMWITLEVPHPEAGHEPRTVRARVMWIQRPRTVRELFQVGVDLEVGGNLWGIAFPPPDWFSFPENLPVPPEIPASSITGEAPGTTADGTPGGISGAEFGVITDAPVEGHEPNWTATPIAEAAVENNLRTMPSAAGSSGALSGSTSAQESGGDASLLMARQMMRLVNEAKQQIQSLIRQSAAQAVTSEARPLMAALHSQIQEAAKQSVAAATEQALAGATERTMQQTSQATEAQLQQLRETWDSKLSESLAQASQTLSTRIAEVEQERRSAFLKELEAETQRAVQNLQQVAQQFQEKIGQAESGVDQLARKAEEAAAPVLAEIEQRMKAHAEEARAQFDEFVRAARQWNEQMSSAASVSQLNWQARLEADIDAAGSRWNELIEKSLVSATQEAATRVARRSQESANAIAGETSSRMATLGQALSDTSDALERKLALLRGSLDQQTARAQEVLAQVMAAARDAEDQHKRIQSLDWTTLQEMERRSTAMLEAHSRELDRRAETTLAAWTERLQPAMQDAGEQAVTRLAAQLEKEFGSQLQRAGDLLDKIESGTQFVSKAADEALRRHDDELGKISEQSIQTAITRMQESIGRLEQGLEQTGHEVTTKWMGEIEAKATETTHTTFESLFKTAEWYEKKVHNQMQTALEKGMELTGEVLRKRAGEISSMFAAELDHYSRSYVEHTQGQIEETGRAAIEAVRKQSAEFSASSVAAIQQETHNQTETALSQFRNKTGVTLTQTSSHLEALAAQARAKFETETQRTQAEFRAALVQEAQVTASKSRQELLGQAELAKENLRAEGKRQETQLRQTMGQLGDQFIENYKKRLENASNSWLLTTVSRLNQQSAQQLDDLTRSADARLRQTCGDVFAGIGETLRRRLADVSVAPVSHNEAGSEQPSDPAGERGNEAPTEKSSLKRA